MTACGICGHEGRHVHQCAGCGGKLTVKAADWRVRQPVNPDGTLAGLVTEHTNCPPRFLAGGTRQEGGLTHA